jgi:hypothetical protein
VELAAKGETASAHEAATRAAGARVAPWSLVRLIAARTAAKHAAAAVRGAEPDCAVCSDKKRLLVQLAGGMCGYYWYRCWSST